MVWFFLAGWISGAVFMVLYARWWVHKHTKRITPEEALNELTKEEDKTHE